MRHPERHLGIVSAETVRWMERQQRQAEELGQTPRWPWPLRCAAEGQLAHEDKNLP